jgi:uridylate kinase
LGKKNRFLIKISGEALKGNLPSGISFDSLDAICKRLSSIIKNTNAELGFVVGGGNIFRGGRGEVQGYNRLYGDQIGMMATVINGLSLVERLRFHGIDAIIQSGVKIDGVADLFNRDGVEAVFAKKGAVVFCGGIGSPYLSTDMTSAIRALQIEADWVFKATKVNGIYDVDPEKNKDAKKFDVMTYDGIIGKNLQVMDLEAILLMKKNNLKLMVFNLTGDGLLEKACAGETVGTIVKE